MFAQKRRKYWYLIVKRTVLTGPCNRTMQFMSDSITFLERAEFV